eukprot:1078653-Pyramimonas_sp.AAC.1
MGMGGGCRTLGNAPVRAGAPIRQRAHMALSDSPMGMGACYSFVKGGGGARAKTEGDFRGEGYGR